NAGGTGAAAGASASGGVTSSGGAPDTKSDSGCGCRVGSQQRSAPLLFLALLVAGLVVRRRASGARAHAAFPAFRRSEPTASERVQLSKMRDVAATAWRPGGHAAGSALHRARNVRR